MEIEVCEPCEQYTFKINMNKPFNICKEENCTTRASYNYEGFKKLMFCAKHRSETMVDIVNRKCQEPKCGKIPYYNYEGETRGVVCQAHAKNGMLNVKDRKCQEPNCGKIPNFNFKGKKTGIFCQEHKKNLMLDVRNKRCEHDNCDKHPNYNYENTVRGIVCYEHRSPDMVNIKFRKCKKEGCDKSATHNFKFGDKVKFCKKHSEKNMINIVEKTCEYIDCLIHPSFNFKGEKKPKFCKKHAHQFMIDVINTRCLNLKCDIIVNHKKYEGYCASCFILLFPDKPVTRNYKVKEKAVSNYIKEQFQELIWISDKKIIGGSSMRRPDLLLDLGYQIIIVEIDEEQHERYNETHENNRIIEISEDIGYRPIILVRFNPDDYFLEDIKITSCWSYNKEGIMSVKKSKQKEWGERLENLKKTVEYWMNNETEKTIELVYLFYDKTI
jgi:hypothetical protein